MPGTIGDTTQGGTSAATATNWDTECLVGAAFRYTAVTGDEVTQANVFGDSDGTARLAVYTWNGTVPVTKVGSDISVTIGTAAQWWTAAASIALTDGVTYVVGISYTTGVDQSWNIRFRTPGAGSTSIDAGTALPATWAQTATSSDATSFYLTVSGPAGATATPGVIVAVTDLAQVTAGGPPPNPALRPIPIRSGLRLA